MAFNPIITQENTPLLYQGEEVIVTLTQSHSTLEFATGRLKNREPGFTHLTNARLIFIHSDITKFKQNFAIHLNLLSEESFVEIENFLVFQGNFSPYSNLMPGPGKFKIEVRENVVEFRLKAQNFIRQIKMANALPISNGISQANQAFVDPNNPDMMIMVSDVPGHKEQKVEI